MQRWLAGLLMLGLVPLPALAQDDDGTRLFQPAPNAPMQPQATAAPTPVTRSTLSDVPMTVATPAPMALSAPPPAMRSALVDAPPQPVSPPPPLRSTPVLMRLPVNTAAAGYGPPKIVFAGGVSAQFDLTYATLNGFRPLTLDLYQPRLTTAAPLIVFIHGGGWNTGDARHAAPFDDFPRALAGLAAQGYVVASVNYRLSEEARFPAALQDVKAAIRWLRGHANDYGIDTTRVAAWGMSAGGQLAALAGVSCGVPRFEPDGGADRDLPSDCVEAVIDWYGATDLEALAADNGRPVEKPAEGTFTQAGSTAEGTYLGCEPATCPPATARLASPLAFINAMSPAFLIQHGAADTTVSPRQSQKLYDALRAKNIPAEMAIYPEVGHEFARDGRSDPVVTAQAMDKVKAFLAATFGGMRVAATKPAPPVRGPLN